MLINLTNHPLDTWEENQKKIAESIYNKIVDLPFPIIPPDEGLDYVQKLSDEYLEKIEALLKNANYENNAVHLMGELTFTYVLLNKLREKGIQAVASTTKRNVIEIQEGKLSRFSFVRFRDYY
ncbi:MAG: hypothetical protein QHH13_05130 [Melioribacter sp.]|uniref:hypothetical protein n=1 Tax=Rosettibacter primus TaxID=3111523 RepID=UPI00247E9B02|nr:hypothetical protein [Melioribacter sp.]